MSTRTVGKAAHGPTIGEGARLEIAFASAKDFTAIYRMRHAVYAAELGQHPTNTAGRLSDSLDSFNHYLVARLGEALIGFVSITPPGHGAYSIDKYIARHELPFAVDDGLFEVRILTVDPAHRGSLVAGLLMYGALRWIEHHGGTRVVAIGRNEVAGLYERVGLRRTGRIVRSGAVSYELMTATVAEVREQVAAFGKLIRRFALHVRWSLSIPFEARPGAFHGGASLEVLGAAPSADDRAAVMAADVLDAWFEPAPGVRRALASDPTFLAATSPPAAPQELREAIAHASGVDPAAIVTGAGLSDLIFRCLPRWVPADARVLVVEPQYGEYRHVLEHLVGCTVDVVRLDPGNATADVALPRSIMSGGHEWVVLVDPNNPLGYQLDQDQLHKALASAPPQTHFWIDRTYAPFARLGRSLEQLAAASPNVIVAMSMSKAYALSGLRLGYLCGPPDLIGDAWLATPPWGLSRPGQAAALAAIADPNYYADCYRETELLREQLERGLAAIPGLRPRSGVANFVFCDVDAPLDAATLVERCRARGFYLRSLPTDVTLRWRGLRITVKDEASQRRMLDILGHVASETATLRARVGDLP